MSATSTGAKAATAQDGLDFLDGGGEMGARMRAFEWSRTSLGPPAGWPQSLRTVLDILLRSQSAIFLWWGPELIQFYNDAYRPILGSAKHPGALGNRGRRTWVEIWDVISPMIEAVMERGESTNVRDGLLVLERNGFPEEGYFDYAYSPIRDESGRIAGVFAACNETTGRVLGERRMDTLRALGSASREDRSAEEACASAARVLAQNQLDVPFALVYLAGGDDSIRLVASSGIALSHPATRPDNWPIARALAPDNGGLAIVLDDLAERAPLLPAHPWPEAPHTAVVLPLTCPGQTAGGPVAGALVLGVSPRLPYDEAYRTFHGLVAGQVAASAASAEVAAEARRRAEALAELDRAKTEFFSNVSHELRTPLTLLLGPLEELLRKPAVPGKEADRESLTVAHRNGLRLLKLVNALLDFSRLEAGRAKASYEPVDLAALTADLASVFRSAVERAGLRLRVECAPLGGVAHVDRDMWEKIVLNLLSNAFKHTLEGEICVGLSRKGESFELTVADTGTGIAEAALPRLFERFYHVPNARARTHEGSGIGLSLVKELVSLHGGTVSVASREGAGSTFTVMIPAGHAHLPGERVRRAPRPTGEAPIARAFVEEALRWLPPATSHAGTNDARALTSLPAEHAGMGAPVVLLVEDNADLRDYVARLLSRHFTVTCAPDGEAALERLRQGPLPDLVLSDVMMPRLGGFELVARVRADARWRELPVILLSARAGEGAHIEGLSSGADDYLVKPFSAGELLARVDAHLRLARSRREASERVRASEAREREAHRRLRTVMNSITDGLLVLDKDWRYTFFSEHGARMIGMRPEQLLGHCAWDLFPAARGTMFHEGLQRAVESGQPVMFEEYYPEPLNKWFECHCYPSEEGLAVYFQDISERKAAEAELRSLAERLEAADRRKDEFLAMLAHELRNPLAPIVNAVHLLGAAGALEPRLSRARDIIDRQVKHLTRLVDDLLDVSRVTQGKIRLIESPIDLADSLRAGLELARPLIDGNHHALTVTLAPEPLQVRGDPTRLAQVVGNLLHNAAKYSAEGGHIELTLARDGSHAVISVKDSGIGIPKDLLPRVFDLFAQAETTLDRSQGGLGIGLSLVKSLVHLHGGEVTAASDGPGKGSLFEVRLPLLTPE